MENQTEIVTTLPSMAAPLPTQQVVDRRSSVVIASIWPFELYTEEPHCQMRVNPKTGESRIIGMTEYRLPPGAPILSEASNQVQLLRVFDSFHMYQVPGTAAEPGGPNRVDPLPLYCRAIADGLVGKWTGESNGASRGPSMGIMAISGDKPTVHEMQQLINAQTSYLQARYNEAQANWVQGRINQIGDIERAAAKWLMVHSKTEWFSSTDIQGMKECLGCGYSMPSSATTCKNCGDLVDKALKGYWSDAELKAKDPDLHRRMTEIRGREAARSKNQNASSGK